jgi:hypothetical protein
MDQTFMGVMEQQTTLTKRTVFFFTAVLFILAVPAGSISLFLHNRYAGWMQLISLLAIGGIYAWVYQKKFRHIPGVSFFALACLFAVFLLFALSILYFFKEQFQFLLIFPLSCAFLLPTAITASWNAFDFSSEVENEKKVWYYHDDPTFDPSFVYIENIPIALRIIIDGNKAAEIKGAMPVALELGMAVSHLVLKKDPLQKGLGSFYDHGMKPYGWIFYTKKIRKKQYLDPEETISGNGVKTNTIIYAERISD